MTVNWQHRERYRRMLADFACTQVLDWSDVLPEDTAITSSAWTIEPPAALSDDTIRGTTTTIQVAEVAFGTTYMLTNLIVASDGKKYTKKITLRGTR